MKSVGCRVTGQTSDAQQDRSKQLRFFRNCQHRQGGDQRQATASNFVISDLYLTKDKFGNKRVVILTLRLPPLARELLIRKRNQVTASPANGVADQARFEIDTWRHYSALSLRRQRLGAARPQQHFV